MKVSFIVTLTTLLLMLATEAVGLESVQDLENNFEVKVRGRDVLEADQGPECDLDGGRDIPEDVVLFKFSNNFLVVPYEEEKMKDLQKNWSKSLRF